MAGNLTIEHKRGDTFRQDVTVKINGVAADITDWVIESQIRSVEKSLIQAFTVTLTAAASGQYRLSAEADETALWPIGKLRMDIQYSYPSDGTFVVSSETYDVKVIQDQTYDE